MAYNVKYILKYCNKDGEPLRIEIAQWDYIGQAFLLINNDSDKVSNVDGDLIVINIDGEYQAGRDENELSGTANPFILEYKTDEEGKKANIMTTTANMSFWADDLFNIDDLQTSDETELKVNFWYNNKLEWTGFVVPDFFSEEVARYREVALTASDRIGILKDIKYPINYNNDNPISEFSILDKCLKLTGLNLGYDILCGITCDEWVPENDLSAFHRSYLKEIRYEKSGTDSGNIETYSCYEVIKDIMVRKNCIISQKMGRWVIHNKQQLEIGNGVLMHFDNSGVFESKEDFTQPEIWYNEIDTGGQRTIIPVGAENTIKLDLGNNVIYPKNNNFRSNFFGIQFWNKTTGFNYNSTNEIPTLYNSSGGVVDSYLDSRDWLEVYDTRKRVSYNDGTGEVFGIDWRWPYLYSQQFKASTNDGQRMSFDLNVKFVAKPNTYINVMILLRFTDRPNDLYSLDPDGFFYNISYAGVLTNTINRVIQIKAENKYKNPLAASEQDFKINVNAAAGTGQEYLDLYKAYFEVRIYPNTYDETAIVSTRSILKNVSIDFKMPNEVPANILYQTVIEGKFTKKMEPYVVLFGDYNTVGKNGWFYQYRDDSNSITFAKDGNFTKNWSTINDPTKENLLMHSVRQVSKSLARATNEYRIKFDIDSIDVSAIYRVKCTSEKRILVNNSYDELTQNDGTFIIANNGTYPNNERYIFVGGSIDYMRQEANMILIQCQDKEVETKEYIYTDFK